MEKINLLTGNANITNYYYYENSFNEEEIEKILEILKTKTQQEGTVSNIIDYSYRKNKVTWLPLTDETNFIYTKIIDLLKDANKKMWNFNITNIVDDIQISEYNYNPIEGEISGHYDWHMDCGGGVSSTRKLSVSIQLSEDDSYEGCDLQFMIHRNIIKAPRKKSTCIIFPSYLTHQVTKITKGTRKSLIFWIHGPSFM